MNEKPGFKTTEFWLVVVSSLLTVAVAGGLLSVGEAQEITDATAQVVEAAGKLAAALMPLVGVVTYIWSRTRVKQTKKE